MSRFTCKMALFVADHLFDGDEQKYECLSPKEVEHD